MLKNKYKFSCHSDHWKRFGSKAEPVGDTEAGYTVWFWRGALWTEQSICGATVGYVATRIEPNAVSTWKNTKAAYRARGLEKPVKPKPFVCDLEFGGTMQGTLKA